MPRLHSCLLLTLLVLPVTIQAADDTSSPASGSDAPAKPPEPPSAAVTNFAAAMASNDSDAKRAAIKALVDQSAGNDDVVLPLLVQAVGDRQGHDTAIEALRARTNLTPSVYAGQSHYPRYPGGDHPEDWNLWLSERTADLAEKAKVANAEKLAKEADKTAAKALKDANKDPATKDTDQATSDGTASATSAAITAGTTSATAAATSPGKHQVADDLGQLNRIVFKNGSSLSCYILTRRTDADGNLLSLRVVHPDGSGEETLDASIIARVEPMH
jgi:hypothetical protein